MEEIDRDLQERVWSRVNSRQDLQPLPESAGHFSELTGELASGYRYLGKKFPTCRDLERKLLENRSQIFSLQALRGIREPRKIYKSPKDSPTMVLERCCHLERRLADGLEKCRSDPEWGEVFAILARQARQRCLAVLALRGK